MFELWLKYIRFYAFALVVGGIGQTLHHISILVGFSKTFQCKVKLSKG